MRCAWQAYLGLLPSWLREDADKFGSECLQETRLRLGRPPELVLAERSMWLNRSVTAQDLQFCLNMATKYSPWTAESLARGYFTAMGGHRLGICGEVVLREGLPATISNITSISIRVARDFSDIGPNIQLLTGSSLLIGSPGCGKTTLLREIIRAMSRVSDGAIAVVDERREIFPLGPDGFCFDTGPRTDVLSGCRKNEGIEMVLRTMNPTIVAMDEITSTDDCDSILLAGWCGVNLLATAHASDRKELYTRAVYQPIVRSGLFQNLIILHKDKSWSLERMDI